MWSLKDPCCYCVEKDGEKERAEAEKPLRWYCNSPGQRWWFALKCEYGFSRCEMKKKKIFQNGNNKYKCRDTRNDRVILENYKLKPYTV